MLGPSKKCIQDLPTIIKQRRSQSQYSSLPGKYSSSNDEEICNSISVLPGCLRPWTEWESGSMGSTEIQGASSVTAEYNGRIGKRGPYRESRRLVRPFISQNG